jgi:2-octaprenyl-6-methoxyphenol hydroxylase
MDEEIMNPIHDIAIIGGGPVGSALALALRDSNLDICVLEARSGESTDTRALALSYGSRLLLERLNAWDKLSDVSLIRTIHISQKQSFGRTLLTASELNVPELGYVLPYPSLKKALRSGRTIQGAQVTELQGDADHATISYRQNGEEHTLRARLAVLADGGKLLADRYPPETRDYGQSALITHVTVASARPDTAFERFTPQGPVALLPYMDGYELVWTAPHSRVEEMLAWDDLRFLNELHSHFGDRVGRFLSVKKRSAFPLGLKKAAEQAPMPHVVLIGNAAQTMHPVAGQGFNMGLRDAWELARVILDAKPDAIGTKEMLTAYRKERRTDREAGIHFTDSLVRLFSNDLPLVSPLRAAALTALDCLPFAKKFVARRMMFGANG